MRIGGPSNAECRLQFRERLATALAVALVAPTLLVDRQLGVALRHDRQAIPVAAPGPDVGARPAALGQQRRQRRKGADCPRNDHDRRDRHGHRVVLDREPFEHRCRILVPDGFEKERVTVVEHAVTDLHDLDIGDIPGDRDPEDVEGAELVGGRDLALHQVPHRPEAVPKHRRLLILLRTGGRAHLGFELVFETAVPARQERDRLVDQRTVVLARDVADAGCQASLDVVIEARNPGRPPRLRPLAGPARKDPADQRQGFAHFRGTAERPEIQPLALVLLTGEVDPRVFLVKTDRDVRIALVVAQLDVERRAVALDEIRLEDQRLGLGRGHDRLETGDPGDHVVDLRMLSGTRGHRIGRVGVSRVRSAGPGSS